MHSCEKNLCYCYITVILCKCAINYPVAACTQIVKTGYACIPSRAAAM